MEVGVFLPTRSTASKQAESQTDISEVLTVFLEEDKHRRVGGQKCTERKAAFRSKLEGEKYPMEPAQKGKDFPELQRLDETL